MIEACKFCGQMVDVGDLCDKPEDLAWRYCDCDQARGEQRIEEQIETARENIAALFAGACEPAGFVPLREARVLDELERLAELCARGMVSKATLVIPGGGVACIYAKADKVCVRRQVVRQAALEAGLFG